MGLEAYRLAPPEIEAGDMEDDEEQDEALSDEKLEEFEDDHLSEEDAEAESAHSRVFLTYGDKKVEVKGRHGRQLSMLAEHPEMDEHVGLVERKVREMASEVLDKTGFAADFAAKLRLHHQFVTHAGVIVDATWTIQVAARPAKVKE